MHENSKRTLDLLERELFLSSTCWRITLEKKYIYIFICEARFPREAVYTMLCKVFIWQSISDSDDGDLLDLQKHLEQLSCLTDKLRKKNGEKYNWDHENSTW